MTFEQVTRFCEFRNNQGKEEQIIPQNQSDGSLEALLADKQSSMPLNVADERIT